MYFTVYKRKIHLYTVNGHCVYSSLVAQWQKNLLANAGDSRDEGLIPGSGRPPGVGNGNPLLHSCLDKNKKLATIHRVAKSWTQLSMHAKEGKGHVNICTNFLLFGA